MKKSRSFYKMFLFRKMKKRLTLLRERQRFLILFFTVVFKTTSYFSTFDVFRKCRCNIYCHVALQLMLLCFSCKQGWVPVPGIKLWKLIDLINNSHKRHDAHMCIPIHMHEKIIYIYKNQFTCTKLEYIFIKYVSQMRNTIHRCTTVYKMFNV